MNNYEIIRITRNRERHTVTASSPQEALRAFENGDASLRDDEVTEVYELFVLTEAGEDVTAEAEEIY